MMRTTLLCALSISLVAAATAARSAETMRGIFPAGPLAPAEASDWEFSSVRGAPEEEIVAFVYLNEPSTTVRVKMTLAPLSVRAVEIYANGTLSERLDGEGPLGRRKASGFNVGQQPTVPLSTGLRPGLNRISLLARFAQDTEDRVQSERPAWAGSLAFSSGRLVHLSLMFRGWERLYDCQAGFYQTFRRFDYDVRVGHPLVPEKNLIDGLGRVGELQEALGRDPSVRMALWESDRLYMEAWSESGNGFGYLKSQLGLGKQIAASWCATAPKWVAHEIYRSNSKRLYLYDALTDVALSKGNLRNACAVLATRAGEAAPEAIQSLLTLMGQDQKLVESLAVTASTVGDGLDGRIKEILTTFPAWREWYIHAYASLRGQMKLVPADYPSRTVVEHEGRVVRAYLDQVRALVQQDSVFGRLQMELAGSLLEPRRPPAAVPKRVW
ncbi:MAG: hypothetical protein HY815_14745 [Candidatus Riflebacteria bacterium]|nr:hypothetical protein [Candidatus Riflebacteria bacterium]